MLDHAICLQRRFIIVRFCLDNGLARRDKMITPFTTEMCEYSRQEEFRLS